MTKIIILVVMKFFQPKAAAKQEHLFNNPASIYKICLKVSQR